MKLQLWTYRHRIHDSKQLSHQINFTQEILFSPWVYEKSNLIIHKTLYLLKLLFLFMFNIISSFFTFILGYYQASALNLSLNFVTWSVIEYYMRHICYSKNVFKTWL
jgi:hypothetical protein